jgi:DNA-binding NarL/FixJ family response regulator
LSTIEEPLVRPQTNGAAVSKRSLYFFGLAGFTGWAELRILIADDHEIIRAGVRAILRWRPDVEIVEASNGEEAIEQARKTNPDLIILDFTMPVMTGIEAARRLKKEMPGVRILILSMHDGQAMTYELAQIGVQGFVSKTDAAQKLPQAIDAVLAGGTFFGGADLSRIPPRPKN